MKAIALRSVPKINSDVLPNFRRLFSFKFEMTPAGRIATEPCEDASSQQEEASNFRYTVCQPRTSPVERPSTVGDVVAAQKQTIKQAIQEQQLQPSMLPEYYQKSMERNVLVNPDPEMNEETRINNAHSSATQRFQVSKTYANAILPLKSVKLANPFPEPVKMMMSRTISDEEKAEQMLAESKSQKAFAKSSLSNMRGFSTNVKRWYSSKKSSVVTTDPEKCKKGPKTKAKGHACPKMSLKGCPPPARTKCDRLAKQMYCKKQECPYPAYSEFCHEDIDEKPSECKMCPWRPEENPNFKPQKKKLHTLPPLHIKRSGLEMDWNETSKSQGIEEQFSSLEETEGMQCDLRKPPCERPKSQRCPPSKDKKKEEEKKKKKEKEKQAAPQLLKDDLLASLQLTKHTKEGEEETQPCKIRKFKFPACQEPPKEQHDEVVHRCPRKKKKQKIHDCPPSEGDESRCQSMHTKGTKGYDSTDDPEGKRKCPDVDLSVMKDEDEDKCKVEKKGTTKVCPGDLLKKKRRNPKEKKTATVVPPVESPGSPAQPTTQTM